MWLSELRTRFFVGSERAAGNAEPLPVQEAPGESARFRWWWFALLFAVVFMLLACRLPGALEKPSFVAEDGFAFFKQNYEEPFGRILFRPHAGYIQVSGRLIAKAAGFFPLEYIPLVYVVTALLVATATMAFFALPYFRDVIRSDALRAVVVLTLPFMPNADSLTRAAWTEWYLLFYIALVSIMTVPANRFAAWSVWLVAAIGFWSQPVAIVCVPVLIYRLWQAKPGAERVWWLALTAVAVVYPFTAESHSVLAALWQAPGVGLALLRAVGYRVFCFFVFGDSVSKSVLQTAGWLVTTRLSLFCLGLCAAAAWWPRAGRSPRTSLLLGILSYYVLVMPDLFVLRTDNIPDFLTVNESTSIAHQRYFYVSVLLLCVLGGVAYEAAVFTWRRHATAAFVLLCWLGLHTTSYRLWEFQSTPAWPHFARHIRSAEERLKQTGAGARIAIQTNPYIFVLDVGSPSPSAEAEW